MSRKSLEVRFWEKVKIASYDDCWEWTAAKSPDGYGCFRVNGVLRHSTHVAYELAWGIPFPKSMHACHACDNPSCVNPLHIWIGTNDDNIRDKIAKNRQPRLKGETNGQSKLTEGQVQQILDRYEREKITQLALAQEYGISRQQMNRIVNRKKWAHVNHSTRKNIQL